MWPSLVANWPNEFLFYRQNLGKPDSFGVNEQKIMFCERQGTLQDALETKISLRPLILTEITMFACTPPTQLFVAQVLGYGAVYLTGMDFAYHGTKERFTNYELEAGKWIRRERHLQDLTREYVMTNNGLKTDPLHLYYLKNFISACRLSMQRVFTTDKGAMTQLPYITIDKLIQTQGTSTKWDIPPQVRSSIYEKYLATLNCFVVNFESGSAFVEVQEPMRDIAGFIQSKNRQYFCGNCKQEIMANDDTDHTGEKCARCGSNATKRISPADFETNMKRIKSLVDYVKEIS
jgi:DNA-directed RNA polymerase subunit RPC12/RpoP